MTATTPTLATFVRDRLAEWLDGLGHVVTDEDERDGFPCLTTESWDGATVEDVAVTSDGRTFSMVDGWREVRLRGFVWVAEPTDTGRVHGPTRADLPPIIAHRYRCPSCDAPAGEPCRLNDFPQDYSHVARHHAARRADWRQMMREIAAGQGPIASIGFGTVGR